VQCSNGHTICSGCKPRVHNRCPTCRHELGNIRCLALEKVAASLELPCKYQNFGCLGIYPYYCKLKHESLCQYRPYSCPYAGSECTVAGDIPYLVNHLKDDHKVDMHSGSTFNHRYVKSNPHEVENATWMLTVFLANTTMIIKNFHLLAFLCCLFMSTEMQNKTRIPRKS
jgi:E3 ubiquitin-protein ligase SIAH1